MQFIVIPGLLHKNFHFQILVSVISKGRMLIFWYGCESIRYDMNASRNGRMRE